MHDSITIYQILTLLGFPAILAAVGGSFVRQVHRQRGDTIALRAGMQALLRAQLINDWQHYSEKGYAPIYARENFENVYQQYHALGANGVMDDIRQKFLALPDKPPEGGTT